MTHDLLNILVISLFKMRKGSQISITSPPHHPIMNKLVENPTPNFNSNEVTPKQSFLVISDHGSRHIYVFTQ